MEDPLFVHACHCLDCKRKTGSSFGLTCIVLEADIHLMSGQLVPVDLSPRSTALRCPHCSKTIYITSTSFPATALLQTGSLEDLRCLRIGAHIWIKRKDSWLQLPEDVLQFEEAYDRDETWPVSSLDRLSKHLAGAN